METQTKTKCAWIGKNKRTCKFNCDQTVLDVSKELGETIIMCYKHYISEKRDNPTSFSIKVVEAIKERIRKASNEKRDTEVKLLKRKAQDDAIEALNPFKDYKVKMPDNMEDVDMLIEEAAIVLGDYVI